MNKRAAPVRVLVADDNEDHRFLITRALRSVTGPNLEVSSVQDGEAALDYLHQRGTFADHGRPSFVILDLKMPKVDGFEVLRQVKADPSLQEIPVIVRSCRSTGPRSCRCPELNGTEPGQIRDNRT
jgi:CheY-like chemotaxis protein